MVRVEIVDPDGTRQGYFNMSQVPRIGDNVSLYCGEEEGMRFSGVVIEVCWILDNEKPEEDNSDCVVVYLGALPDDHPLSYKPTQ